MPMSKHSSFVDKPLLQLHESLQDDEANCKAMQSNTFQANATSNTELHERLSSSVAFALFALQG
eukprot:925120-Amphidinium_carterae.1